MISKILVANRGEIAVRIIKTCQKLNIKTVAVYSDIDKEALFVNMADEAYSLGGVKAAETYLDIDKILNIASKSKTDAIHPGYGFLSENAEFARKVVNNGLKFIGPSADAILSMGLKSTAKDIMQASGVAVMPGYNGSDNSEQKLLQEAKKIGYPVLLKAAAGGGGKGMRIVNSEQELPSAISAAKREAQKSFSNDHLILEKYLINPRHIEVQLICDNHGHGVYLFERDCSMQRRYQKVIEEAPAPNISEELRTKLGEQALLAAKAISYSGAGTVEFLVDANGKNCYFMEMNTRLQVEHPVTELITGLDLVELQIKVANDEQLKLAQKDLQIKGVAIEARVYAEDVANNFLPASGRVQYLEYPEIDNIRIDNGIKNNEKIDIHYDPMLSKIIAYGDNRKQAIDNLINAIDNTHILGLKTNLSFLSRCLDHADFRTGKLSTNFIQQHQDDLLAEKNDIANLFHFWIAAGIYKNFYKSDLNKSLAQQSISNDPWDELCNFRVNQKNSYKFNLYLTQSQLHQEEITKEITIESRDNTLNSIIASIDGMSFSCENISFCNNNLSFTLGNEENSTWVKSNYVFKLVLVNNKIYLHNNGVRYLFEDTDTYHSAGTTHHKGALNAPMHGTIVAVNVNAGAKVDQGDALVILEAMKMEHVIVAPRQGVVLNINFKQGEQVAEGAELLVME